MTDSKIFNIGLPKTGTTSLHTALKVLGFRSLHNPLDLRWLTYYRGVYRYPRDDWDALTNFGEHFYPQLDRHYTAAQFILTIRDKDDWLASAEKWFSRAPENPMIDYPGRLETFGCMTFERDRFAYVYELHRSNVEAYFSARPEDLLVLDCSDTGAWEKLCRFLDRPVPEQPYPHETVVRRSRLSAYRLRNWVKYWLYPVLLPKQPSPKAAQTTGASEGLAEGAPKPCGRSREQCSKTEQ